MDDYVSNKELLINKKYIRVETVGSVLVEVC